MSLAATNLVQAPDQSAQIDLSSLSDRRADIDAKQALVGKLLKETEAEAILIMDAGNFAWLTGGGVARGVLDQREMPLLYLNAEQRWILSSNADSQRLFDEEVNGLGFQLKEWPWHWGREQLLADLCYNRTLACDLPFGSCKPVGAALGRMRQALSLYEQACLRSLGQILSHALEATCRTMSQNQTERETAGQLSHRLLHRGAQPISVGVAADGRSRLYRQWGFTDTPIHRYCVIAVTARKFGLCATASRALNFGQLDDTFRQEYDAACKISATYVASTWPDAVPREILNAGKRVYMISGYEHEWLAGPQGHVTGRDPVELAFTPQTEELFQPGWAVTWRAGVGAANSCDTFLVTDKGPDIITKTEIWPLSRIRVQGADFFRPYIYQR